MIIKLKRVGMMMLILMLNSTLVQTMNAQKTYKKQKTININRTIDASIDEVWRVVAEDFGAISKSHPLVKISLKLSYSLN